MHYIHMIAGLNGAGKTTASFTLLPEILHCKEFINADQIAFGLSPFDPDKVSIQAGKIMITRINELMQKKATFAVETTLAARSYVSLIQRAKAKGYMICLYYFWLRCVDIAKERVQKRVANGGHNIPIEVIERRYTRGIVNLIRLYLPMSDSWFVLNGEHAHPELIAYKEIVGKIEVINKHGWKTILKQSKQ